MSGVTDNQGKDRMGRLSGDAQPAIRCGSARPCHQMHVGHAPAATAPDSLADWPDMHDPRRVHSGLRTPIMRQARVEDPDHASGPG